MFEIKLGVIQSKKKIIILRLFFSFEILAPHIEEIVVIPVDQKDQDHPDLKVVAVEPKVSYLSYFRCMKFNIECF